MKFRLILFLTAFVSAMLGATVVYLMLSVPNDLRADAMLKTARQQMTDGNNDEARQSLSRIVQQYPRTDAAAAATVALASLGKKERDDLALAVAVLRRQNELQSRQIADLQKSVAAIRNAPPPSAATVTPSAPKPVVKTVTAKKKPTPKKKATSKKRPRR